jgi:prefoldin subunit 5
MANKKKKFLPDNIIELMFGLGASIVIIGALLKITHADLIPGYVTGNTMLTIGLIVEAVIFAISGIQGYMVGDSSIEDKGLQTIEAETQSLQQAVDQTVSGLSSLNKNLTAATAATESFNVPKDINENLNIYNDNLSSAAAKLTNINELYDSLNKTLSEVNSSTSSMNIPEGLGEELNKMKSTINELNAKYSSMLEGMNK